MKKQTLIALLLVCALLFSLSGCGKSGGDGSAEPEGSASASAGAEEEAPPRQEEEDAVYPFGLGYYKGLGLNPYTCDNTQNQSIMGLLYEPLFELDQHFTAQPCLAQSLTAKVRTEQVPVKTDKQTTDGSDEEDDSSEGKAKTTTSYVTDVTVKLRKGVKFTDGSTLHADDVAYSLQRAAAKGSVYRSRLSGMTNVRTSGKSTVKFTLSGGNVSVAELLEVPIIKSGDGDELFPVGTGPYVVKRSKKGVPTQLTAHSGWWRLGQEYEVALTQGIDPEDSAAGESVFTKTVALPLQSIGIYTANDSDELIFGFSSGAVTAVSSDLTGTDALQYLGSYDVTDYPTTDLIYLGCNTDKGPCKEQKLRQAVYRSVNRERMVTGMLAGHGQAALMPVSPQSSLYDTELAKTLEYQRSEAEKLCKEAGVTSELKLIVNSDSSFKVAMAKRISRELRETGLSVKTDVLSWKEYREALKSGAYDLYLGEVRLNANFDLSRLVEEKGSLNFSKYKDKELQKASRTFNQAGKGSRQKAASQLYTLLAEQAPFVPVCFKNHSLLSRTEVLQKQRSTQGNLFYDLWDWSIDERVRNASM